jgi:CRP-like cAMP-binding protein
MSNQFQRLNLRFCWMRQSSAGGCALTDTLLALRYPRLVVRVIDLDELEDFAFKSVPARLSGALLRLLDTSENNTVHASHQELADMTGAYRETVTLALDELQSRGLVNLSRRSIEIVDQPALERLAEG